MSCCALKRRGDRACPIPLSSRFLPDLRAGLDRILLGLVIAQKQAAVIKELYRFSKKIALNQILNSSCPTCAPSRAGRGRQVGVRRKRT